MARGHFKSNPSKRRASMVLDRTQRSKLSKVNYLEHRRRTQRSKPHHLHMRAPLKMKTPRRGRRTWKADTPISVKRIIATIANRIHSEPSPLLPDPESAEGTFLYAGLS